MKIIKDVYTVESLRYVGTMLTKYAHRWNAAMEKECMPSDRITKWFYYYEDARGTAPDVWKQYCETYNRSKNHDASDIMA